MLRPLRSKFALGVLAGVLAGVFGGAGIPFVTEHVFPLIFVDENGERALPSEVIQAVATFLRIPVTTGSMLILACTLIPLTFLLRGICAFTSSYFTTFTGVSLLEQLRLRIFAKLQRLPLSFHAKHKGGDLISRLMGDTSAVQQSIVNCSADLIKEPFTLIAAVSYLISKGLENRAIGVVLLAAVSIPLCVIPIRMVSKRLRRKAKALQKNAGELSAVLSENLASQPEIRAYNMQDAEVGEFSNLGKRLVRLTLKTVKYKLFTSPAIEVVSAFGITFAIYYGAKLGLTLQEFVPLLMALFFCYEPVKKLGAVQNKLKQGEVSLDRLETILNADEGLPEPKSPNRLTNVRGELEFKNVTFSYNDEPTVTDLSFQLEPGTTTALVGASGAGKTTVVNLIERFYDVDSGQILLDGTDLRELSLHHLREQIAYVAQSPVLFSGTIEENILIGKPGSSHEDVVAAAKAAFAHDFISASEDGYQTVLGERGVGLSGGQRQRIAIARACLRDAPILIMDEATSALDSESEAKVQKALTELSKGRTTLIIAHRFSSIRDASRILVFEKRKNGGAIVGDGTHQELMENCPAYKALYTQQTLEEA